MGFSRDPGPTSRLRDLMLQRNSPDPVRMAHSLAMFDPLIWQSLAKVQYQKLDRQITYPVCFPSLCHTMDTMWRSHVVGRLYTRIDFQPPGVQEITQSRPVVENGVFGVGGNNPRLFGQSRAGIAASFAPRRRLESAPCRRQPGQDADFGRLPRPIIAGDAHVFRRYDSTCRA
jgi:hypothetical protein